ncbi:MAG: ATP-binding protein, partial [Armatimonadetes bacterium]|nr:ATP-binding protein [Armatimonadota bacterium]
DEQLPALRLLDAFAVADHPLSFEEAFSLLSAHLPNPDVEQARVVLNLLRRDHYLVQQPDGTHEFYLPLIRRWWRLHRGLPQ